MVWKNIFFVLVCCLGFTLLSTGINNISAAGISNAGNFAAGHKYGAGNGITASQAMGAALTTSFKSHFVKITPPVLDDFFMLNAGLPYDQIKDTAVWGKYICFVSESLACLDNTAPQDPAKTIYPFDLLNGDLVDEYINDISANDNILYVATSKNIYKFVLAKDGKFTKTVELKKGAYQVTAYKGGIVYVDWNNNVLSGTNLPANIPELGSNGDINVYDLFSTKSYLFVVEESFSYPSSIYRWKPGLGNWETVETNTYLEHYASDYENDKLYTAGYGDTGGSKITRCLIKPQIECSEFGSDSQGEITSIFLDGKKLYRVIDNVVSWADKDAENPFFNYVASADAGQTVTKAIDGSIYAFSQDGIKVFIDKGLGAQSEWSKKSIKPSMLSVKGGSFTKPWAGGLFMVKENVLYRKVNSTWEKS